MLVFVFWKRALCGLIKERWPPTGANGDKGSSRQRAEKSGPGKQQPLREVGALLMRGPRAQGELAPSETTSERINIEAIPVGIQVGHR